MKLILPGMGANSKMYKGPWHELENSCFVEWPSYDGEISISDLARRIVTEFRINQNDTVIGSSLGGMVGLEIAGIVELKKVFLIGSAVSPGEFSLFSKLLMTIAGRLVVKTTQLISSFSDNFFLEMYSNSDPDLIISMSKAMLNWQGFRGDLKKVARIHGKKDKLIKCPENSEIIENGGHIIAISHPRECVDFIKNINTGMGRKGIIPQG